MDKKKKNCGIATIYTVEYYLARRNGLYFTVWMNCKNNTEWKKSHTKFGSIYYAYNRKNQPTVTESRLVVTWGSGFRVLSIMGHERWGGSQKVNKSVKSHWNWSTSSRCFLILVNDLSPFMSHSLVMVKELANSIKLWAMPRRAIQDRL